MSDDRHKLLLALREEKAQLDKRADVIGFTAGFSSEGDTELHKELSNELRQLMSDSEKWRARMHEFYDGTIKENL